MSDTPSTDATAFEGLVRELAPRVLGVVARRFGDFDAAEDAVQEALLAAFRHWPREGVPENPRGWLIQVASRRMCDHIRGESARRRREEVALSREPPPAEPSERDDTLSVLFMCCHPALTGPSAVALTLRAVGGLTTAEIARAFLVPEATMAQRISRAKRRIKASGTPFTMPTADEWTPRLRLVLRVLYLIFNEGYASSSGPELHRVGLSREAIRLTGAVSRALPDDAEVEGLLALMLLTDARRPARTAPDGTPVPLDEQDRALWDHQLIAQGSELLARALTKRSVGEYQLQAAIAAIHGQTPHAADTDWPQILALYGLLERLTGNPVVTLNRAVATAMVHGPAAGLAVLEPLDDQLPDHYRLDAVRGRLLELAGDTEAALRHLDAAARGATNLAERRYLTTRAARLRARPGPTVAEP